MTRFKFLHKNRPREASFTLFEVIISIAIMSAMIVELVSFQGNVIYFSEYGLNGSRAMWLAKRVMSKVEYYAQTKSFAELKAESSSDVPFEDFPDFSYKLSIQEFKLPFLDAILGGENGEGGEAAEGAAAAGGGMADMVKQQLGGDPFKVAHVDVSWAEGARRNSVGLTLLLTNQKALDEKLALLKNTWEDLEKKDRGKAKEEKKDPNKDENPNKNDVPVDDF